MKKVIIATALSVVASAHLFAADSIEGAFAAGKTTGEISAFYNSTDNKTDDTSVTIGSLNLLYSTDSFHGLKANVGMRTNMLINEKNDADYDNDADKVVVNVANLEYSRGIGTLIAGRQAIGLEWIGDYHNAVVGVLSTNGLTLVAGYTDSKAITDPDAPLAKFSDIGEDGAYVVDAVYDIAGHAKVNAYYMTADTVYNSDGDLLKGFSAVGGKIEGSAMGINVVAKYAQTKEDAVDTPDGDIMAFEAGYSTDAFGVKAGYIATDKTGGIGSLAALGDNINPLDTGNAVYGTDAKTYYVGANASVAGFDLGALYGSTKYDSYEGVTTAGTEKELNLTIGKELAKNFNASILYADISAEDSASDSSYISAQLTYSF